MAGKGSSRRPEGVGLYNEELKLKDLSKDLFWEKDPEKKKLIKVKIEELKKELYDL
jgi:hypothetical protein